MGKRIESLGKFLREFFTGIAYLEVEQTVRQEKSSRQSLLLLLTFGDLLGVPVFPPGPGVVLPGVYVSPGSSIKS